MKSLLRWFNGLKRSSAKWEYPLNATYDEFEEANPQFPTLPFIAIREKFILDNPILKIVEVIKKTPEKFLVTDDGSPLKIKVPKS
jgi:hypothetical protein